MTPLPIHSVALSNEAGIKEAVSNRLSGIVDAVSLGSADAGDRIAGTHRLANGIDAFGRTVHAIR